MGKGADGLEATLEYSILALEAERVIARYIGSPAAIAYNRSIVRASLESLEADSMLGGPEEPVDRLNWIASTEQPLAGVVLRLPAGWVYEPDGPLACEGLPSAHVVRAASPVGNHALSLRLAIWQAAPMEATAAAALCAPGRRRPESAEYGRQLSWLGTTYAVEGEFLAAGGGLLQIEAAAPIEQRQDVADLLRAWREQLRR
jgi:hypothetical protein